MLNAVDLLIGSDDRVLLSLCSLYLIIMHDDLEQGGGVEARQQQPLLRDSTDKRNVIWTALIWIWRICIFAVTGSSSVAVTRFILEHIFGTAMGG